MWLQGRWTGLYSRVLRVGGGGGSAQGWRRPFRCFIFGRGQREARAVHASAGGG